MRRPVKVKLALLLLVAALAAADSAPAVTDASVPRGLYVIGDSLAFDSRVPLRHRLPRWEIEENFSFARDATETARDLRKRAADDVPLPPVIHVSTGTADDPSRPRRFRTAIRTVMRAAGKHRCAVWANIWRPSVGELTFTGLNKVLAKEEAGRKNLHVVDWYAMLEAHHGWLIDAIHVSDEGNRARARAVADEVRACRSQLD